MLCFNFVTFVYFVVKTLVLRVFVPALTWGTGYCYFILK